MKTTIVIYFDEPGILGYPLNYTIYYQSYQWFSEYCASKGVDIIMCRDDSYQGKMTFSAGYRYKGELLEEVPGPITADLIYLKSLNPPENISPADLVVNAPEFYNLCGDKWATYEVLHEFMPKTFLINKDNWKDVLRQITTTKVVLKPVHGLSGRGVIITDRRGFDFTSLELDEPYIAQEFVDTAKGHPGLVDQVHDLRLILFNGEVKFARLRLPKPGMLLSNIALGASARAVDVKDVPEAAMKVAREADKHFEKYFPRIYTIDLLLQDGKAYIGELNRRPGFPHLTLEGKEYTDAFYRHLLDAFLEAINQPRHA